VCSNVARCNSNAHSVLAATSVLCSVLACKLYALHSSVRQFTITAATTTAAIATVTAVIASAAVT
jgi:hypothetical protein